MRDDGARTRRLAGAALGTSLVALACAAGAPGWAAGLLDGASLKPHSVTRAKLASDVPLPVATQKQATPFLSLAAAPVIRGPVGSMAVAKGRYLLTAEILLGPTVAAQAAVSVACDLRWPGLVGPEGQLGLESVPFDGFTGRTLVLQTVQTVPQGNVAIRCGAAPVNHALVASWKLIAVRVG